MKVVNLGRTLTLVIVLGSLPGAFILIEAIKHFETKDTIIIEALGRDEPIKNPHAPGSGYMKFPWLASVEKDGERICAGALIDNIHVLSSAFCLPNVTNDDVSRLQVGIGFQIFGNETKPVWNGQSVKGQGESPFYLRRVSKVIMDRSFYYQSIAMRNSLMILKLDAPITYNDYARAIHLSPFFNGTSGGLPNNNNKQRTSGGGQRPPGPPLPPPPPPPPMKAAKIAGWRKGVDTSGSEVSFLRGLNLRIHSFEECRKEFLNSNKMEDVICASSAMGSTCYFGLGSPLSVKKDRKNYLVGLRERDCHFPNVFTRTDYFLPWITKNLIY